jgi:hypothetical protein
MQEIKNVMYLDTDNALTTSITRIFWKRQDTFVCLSILLLTACRRTSPARSILSKVAFVFSKSRCSFSTTLAYELRTPVISSMSVLHCFSGRSLRLKRVLLINLMYWLPWGSLVDHVSINFSTARTISGSQDHIIYQRLSLHGVK